MKIKVSPLLVLMALVLILLGYGLEFLSYFIVIIFHEFAHGQASNRLGYSLNVIKLMPHGASLTGAFEGVKWSDEVLIALAGPLINIIFAIVFVALWWLIPSTYFFSETFVIANACTALFNLLPIFPLDGGRAFLAIVSRYVKREKVYFYMRIIGTVFALVFASAFIITFIKGINFSFGLIATFIFLSTIFPDKNSKYQRLYSMAYRSEKLKNGISVKEIIVKDDITFVEIMRMLNGNYYHKFTFVDKNFKPVGQINETELESLMAKSASSESVLSKLRH